MDSPGLRCLNCDQEIAPGRGKFFAEVFICDNCNTVVLRLYERAQQELKAALVMMKDALRITLLQKKLQFKTPEQISKLKKQDLLGELGKLVDQVQTRDAQCHTPVTPSTESTKRPAVTLDVPSSASSTKQDLSDTESETK